MSLPAWFPLNGRGRETRERDARIQSGSMADPEAPRSKRELAYIVGFTILTFALGASLALGVPALLLIRAVDRDATAWGLISGAAGLLWIAVLLLAVIRQRETRGWLVFALVGWVSYLRPLLRHLGAAMRRSRTR